MTNLPCLRTGRILPVLALLILAGCAGTGVTNVMSSHPIKTSAPRTIAVLTDVKLAYSPRHESVATQSDAADQVNTALNSDLKATLLSNHLTVVDATEHPDLLLRSRIVDVRRGKKALRLLVGYGAGRAELQVSSSLELPHAPRSEPLLSFQTKSTTGGMPGNLISAAVKSLGKDGLDVEVMETVKQIDDELGKYFVAQGWPYLDSSPHVDAPKSDAP